MSRIGLKTFLKDPFAANLMNQIKSAGAIRSSLLDITNKCNLRCQGCYYFTEKMDAHKKVESEDEFDQFIAQEVARGINMLTVVGGEPALEIDRLRKLAQHFKITVVTNGTFKIPKEGLENIRIGISFWGNEEQDLLLRGNGKKNILNQALVNFKDDTRAGFYYTTVTGFTDGIAEAAKKMVQNNNFVAFNYYGDLTNKGGKYTHEAGFTEVNKIVKNLADQYPEKILASPYLGDVINSKNLKGQKWGYMTCPSVTFDHPENLDRKKEGGTSYPSVFRAYNADLKTTRRCCIGNARNCSTCTDTWAINGWIIGAFKDHLGSTTDFESWLFTTYIFYVATGFIHLQTAADFLPEVYSRFAQHGHLPDLHSPQSVQSLAVN